MKMKKAKKLQKENKTRIYAMWRCSLSLSCLVQSLFMISFSYSNIILAIIKCFLMCHLISSQNLDTIFFCRRYYFCNYQLFPSLSHIVL